MNWEDSLDSLVIDDSAYRESFVNTASLAGDYCAGKQLRADFVALFDATTHVNNIADFEMRYIFFEAFGLDSIQQFRFHCIFPYPILFVVHSSLFVVC